MEHGKLDRPRGRVEARRHPRFKLEVEVTIHSQEAGPVPGRSLEISESGISTILPVELSVGETVRMDIKLPRGTASLEAVVRNRSVFRHGFEFIQPTTARSLIWEAGIIRLADS